VIEVEAFVEVEALVEVVVEIEVEAFVVVVVAGETTPPDVGTAAPTWISAQVM